VRGIVAVKPGSRRDLEKRTGISRSEQVRIERLVALADAFPFMQRADNGSMTVMVVDRSTTRSGRGSWSRAAPST
jgi:hypothetical protein